MGIFNFTEKIIFNNKLKKINNKKFNLFVCYHKPFRLLESDIVTPIHAGRAVAMNKNKDGAISEKDFRFMKSKMIGDDSGINISETNRFFCENTVTYWIWKMVKSKYVGLMHYRRIFDFSGGKGKPDDAKPLKTHDITKNNLEKLMKNYDIILPVKLGFNYTLYEQYAKCHYIGDLDYVLEFICQKYPDMTEYINKFKTTNIGYFYNMVFTSKEIYDGYAEWLFDVLFQFERWSRENKSNNINERSLYQQRACAFLAERLSGIYFEYITKTKNLRVLEVPVVGIEEPKVHARIFKKYYSNKNKERSITFAFRFKIKF